MVIAFHLDENIPPALADALRHRRINVTTTTDAGLVGAEDRDHLTFATNAGRVLVTQDVDFLGLHSEGVRHSGIAYWHPRRRTLGDALRRLELIHAALLPEEMMDRIEYL